MVDEMLIACEEWIPQYEEDIKKPKVRWENAVKENDLIPPIETRGAARLKTESIEEMSENFLRARKLVSQTDKANT